MNDRWYLVERFDDADNGYQVEERLTQKQYNDYVKEWNNGKDRAKQSIQRSVSRLTSLDKRRNTVRGEEHSADSLQTEHGREDSSIQRVGEEKSQSRQTPSNRGRDSESSGSSKQSLTKGKSKFSLKESVEKDVLLKYGKTYRWVETGYILTDGSRLDLSGKNDGAPGGYILR